MASEREEMSSEVKKKNRPYTCSKIYLTVPKSNQAALSVTSAHFTRVTLNLTSCFEGQSAPWTETTARPLVPQPTTQTRRKHQKSSKAARSSFVKDAFKAWEEKIYIYMKQIQQ